MMPRMTSPENNEHDLFDALTAHIDTAEDPATRASKEIEHAQAELIKTLGRYALNPLPAHYDDAHEALYDTVHAIAEGMLEIIEATKDDITERINIVCGLSNILAEQRHRAFSEILPRKYTILDTRTPAEMDERREALEFILDGKDMMGDELPSFNPNDTLSLAVDAGRMLAQDLHDDVDEFYQRGNIQQIEETQEVKATQQTKEEPVEG